MRRIFSSDPSLIDSIIPYLPKLTRKFDSGSIDRTKLHQYTVIMAKFQVFHLFYFFLGHTFSARKSLQQVVHMIQDVPTISIQMQKAFVAKICLSENPDSTIITQLLTAFPKAHRSFFTAKDKSES